MNTELWPVFVIFQNTRNTLKFDVFVRRTIYWLTQIRYMFTNSTKNGLESTRIGFISTRLVINQWLRGHFEGGGTISRKCFRPVGIVSFPWCIRDDLIVRGIDSQSPPWIEDKWRVTWITSSFLHGAKRKNICESHRIAANIIVSTIIYLHIFQSCGGSGNLMSIAPMNSWCLE